jgi:hypothetical protein
MPPLNEMVGLERSGYHVKIMYEIRIYRLTDNRHSKVRVTTIKKSGNWFGIVGWLRLWFTIRKTGKQRVENERHIERAWAAAKN